MMMMMKNVCLTTLLFSSTMGLLMTEAASSTSLSSISSSSLPAIKSSSKLGNRLLSKARRQLNGNDDDAVDYSWVQNYSIKFESCHTIAEFRADGGSNSNDEADASPIEMTRLVKFKLCPTLDYEYDTTSSSASQYQYTASCGSCKHGAEYLVEMREFLEAYLDFHLTQQEYNCEQVEENCGCGNDDDSGACLSACYAAANIDYCDQFASNDGDDNKNYEFDLDEYLECKNVLEEQDDDYNTQRLYVGATCSSNGKAIHLGEFQDRQCTNPADSGSYLALFGQDLPYQTTSIVKNNECLSCLEPTDNDDDANNNDNADDDAVREICEELYDRSAKCESNLDDGVATTKSTGACEYMHTTLPRTEKVVNSINTGGRRSVTIQASTFFACLFFASTVAAASYAFMLHRKIEDISSGEVTKTSSKEVNLLAADGEVA